MPEACPPPPFHLGNMIRTPFVAKSGMTFHTKERKILITAVTIQNHVVQLKTGNSGTMGSGPADAQ